MVEKILANASPEKRLFISLITRDISLAEALLDLIDNSINAALEPLAGKLKTANDYQRLLDDKNIKPKVQINLTVHTDKIEIKDNAPGISLTTAKNHVFKFGRDTDEANDFDRLSVYGIGLKRAMFKCGNKVLIKSDNRQGGFELDINVKKWAKIKTEPWQFEISERPAREDNCGTRILITDLHDEVLRRLDDGLFMSQLRDRIARTYSFFIGRVVDISLNGLSMKKKFSILGVTTPERKLYLERSLAISPLELRQLLDQFFAIRMRDGLFSVMDVPFCLRTSRMLLDGLMRDYRYSSLNTVHFWGPSFSFRQTPKRFHGPPPKRL